MHNTIEDYFDVVGINLRKVNDMTDVIYLKDENGNLVSLQEKPYDTEEVFQKLLEDYPKLLSFTESSEWVLLKREMEIPDTEGGSGQYFLDHFFVNSEAMPILVEVKRSNDTRIRREVVGQMLDYAVNSSLYLDVNKIRVKYEAVNGNITEKFQNIEMDDDLFWSTLNNNLKLAKMKLIFVADEIPDSLLRIIEFLNNQMTNTEVLGIEIRQFIENGAKQIFVPKIVGNTAQANIVKKSVKGDWNRESFLDDVEDKGGLKSRYIAERMLKDMVNIGCSIWYGKGIKHSSVVFYYDFRYQGKIVSNQFLNVYPWQKDVYLEIDFQYFKYPFKDGYGKRIIKEKIENALKIEIPETKLNGRPTYSLSILEDNARYSNLLDVIRYMLLEFDKVKDSD